jgi:hypothetical protein
MKKKNKEQSKVEKKASPAQQRIVMRPDEDKKKNVAAYLVQCRKGLRASIFIGNIMFISGLVVAVGYILLNIAINSWSISYVNGAPVKDYNSIILFGLLYFAVGCIVAGVIRFTASTMSGKNIKDRANEKIEFENNVFRYTYDNAKKLQLRKIVEMPLGAPESTTATMSYDPKTAEIVFKCDMKANEMDKSAEAGKKVTSGKISELVIYDYFEPSIHLVLKNHGYRFKEPGDSEDDDVWEEK